MFEVTEMHVEVILLGCVLFVSLVNTLIQIGTSRNVARLVQHELDKINRESDMWHAKNVTYKDAYMVNQEPPSDGLNIAHFMS